MFLRYMTTRGNLVVADQKIAGRNRAHCIHVSELHSIQSIAESLQKTVLADDFLLSIQSISLQINGYSSIMYSLLWDDFFCNRVIKRSEYGDVNTVYVEQWLAKNRNKQRKT